MDFSFALQCVIYGGERARRPTWPANQVVFLLRSHSVQHLESVRVSCDLSKPPLVANILTSTLVDTLVRTIGTSGVIEVWIPTSIDLLANDWSTERSS